MCHPHTILFLLLRIQGRLDCKLADFWVANQESCEVQQQ